MLKKIIAAAALATIAASSYAGTPGSYYAGADVGSTKINAFDDTSTSYGAFVGYNFTENFAVEGGYRRLFSYTGYNFDRNTDQTALSAIASLPLSNGFRVYGRLGANRLAEKTSVVGYDHKYDETKVLYGVGASYDFGNKLSGRLEVQKPSGGLTNLSAGVSYSF
jgi:OOP family OmpA-OmpF porin